MTGLLGVFEAELKFRGLAPESMYRYLRVAQMYLDSGGDFSRASVLQFVEIKLNKSAGTYRRWCFDVLKRFFTSCEKPWPFRPNEGPHPSEPKRPYLTKEQAHALLELSKKSVLDHALFRLAAITGARRAELAAIQVADLAKQNGGMVLHIQAKKHGGRRNLPLDGETAEAVERWLSLRGGSPGPLFCHISGRGLSPDELGARFRAYRRALGLPEGTGLHAMRRGVVTWLYQAGMGERELQQWGGWKSPHMPHAYIQLEDDEVTGKAMSLNPIAGV